MWLKFDYFHIKEAIDEADKIPIGKVAKIIKIECKKISCVHAKITTSWYLPAIIVSKEFQSHLVSPVGIVFRIPFWEQTASVNVCTQSRLFFKNIESLQYVYLF